ncbi:MAG: (2E,6E)-farnesyl diphosphate synthase [Gammaproteobacteria bacterium]
MPLQEFMQEMQLRVEAALGRYLPAPNAAPAHLHEAMRYAVLDGGKRIRPLLVYATGGALGVDYNRLDGPACAVELIHAYSLVHDDLPAMDNDELRRGKPTCHKAFGEATAILAGDSLLALAFHILSDDPGMQANAELRVTMIQTLAKASGSRGLAGGQAMDLAAVGCELNLAELEMMHIHKTGALIRASVMLGAHSQPEVDGRWLTALDHYAKCIGLAFQIHDDILDVEGDTATLGKTQGADMTLNKPTYPAIVGMSRAKKMARELHEEALTSLAPFHERADVLRSISAYLIERKS